VTELIIDKFPSLLPNRKSKTTRSGRERKKKRKGRGGKRPVVRPRFHLDGNLRKKGERTGGKRRKKRRKDRPLLCGRKLHDLEEKKKGGRKRVD